MYMEHVLVHALTPNPRPIIISLVERKKGTPDASKISDSEVQKYKKVLKSGPSVDKVSVYFFNITYRTVDVHWLDYEGVPKHFKSLPPHRYFMSSTFSGHPWIAVDTKTHNRMHIGRNYVYYPPNDDPNQNYAMITLPPYPLRMRCLEIIGDRLTSTENIEQLELPLTLKDDVIQMVSNRKQNFVELYKKDWTIGLPQGESDQYEAIT